MFGRGCGAQSGVDTWHTQRPEYGQVERFVSQRRRRSEGSHLESRLLTVPHRNCGKFSRDGFGNTSESFHETSGRVRCSKEIDRYSRLFDARGFCRHRVEIIPSGRKLRISQETLGRRSTPSRNEFWVFNPVQKLDRQGHPFFIKGSHVCTQSTHSAKPKSTSHNSFGSLHTTYSQPQHSFSRVSPQLHHLWTFFAFCQTTVICITSSPAHLSPLFLNSLSLIFSRSKICLVSLSIYFFYFILKLLHSTTQHNHTQHPRSTLLVSETQRV